MKLCDLHCDTPLEMYRRGEELLDNSLMVSLKKAAVFDRYVQCAAIWSDRRYSDEKCFLRFLLCTDYFRRLCGGLICKDADALKSSGKYAFVLAVEDARLLAGDLDRLDVLYSRGVRLLTLVWKGVSCIGGAWDTDEGLTAFGADCVDRCFETGIIPDVSHGNSHMIRQVCLMGQRSGKPVVSTHGNSYTLCRTKRNLSDASLRAVADTGGICGVNLCPGHLTKGPICRAGDVIRHIAYLVNVCGADSVALGCDFDGIDTTPRWLSDVSCLPVLYDGLSRSFGQDIADKILFSNAYNFLLSNI